MDPVPVPTTATTTAPPLVSAYKNPYDSAVLDTAVKSIGDATKQRRNQLGTEAFGAGAFGDGRHGVESATLTDDMTRAIGDLTGQVNSAGFDKSMGWMGEDLDRQMTAGFNNAQLDNQWFQNQMQALTLGNNLEQGSLANGMSLADAMMGLDEYDRGWMQQDKNVEYEDFLAKTGWDDNRLNQFLSVISGVPGQTGTSSSTSSPNNSWASTLAASLSGVKDSSGRRLFS